MEKEPKKSSEHHFGPNELHLDKPGVPEDENNGLSPSPNGQIQKSKEEPISEWPYGHFQPHKEKKP